MVRLIIKSTFNYNYVVVDNNDREYNVNIEFYGLQELPVVGDYLYVDETMLNEINNNMVSFGPIDGKYGKDINSIDASEVICLVHGNNSVYLKRFYG